MSHLEDLLVQYHEWQGFIVRRNIKVGPLPHGGWEGELDSEFSPAEETWIRTTIRKLIRRAGDDLDPLPAKITIADLPGLS